MIYPAKVARIHRYGPPEVLTFEDMDVEAPGPGQVLVRNKMLGLNAGRAGGYGRGDDDDRAGARAERLRDIVGGRFGWSRWAEDGG